MIDKFIIRYISLSEIITIHEEKALRSAFDTTSCKMTQQMLSNVLTINRLVSHFTTDNVDVMRSCIFEQLNCENEAQFLSKVLNICYKHKLLSNESIKTIKNKALKTADEQKIVTSERSQTVCQYVENQYNDELSRSSSDIIDCLGDYLKDGDSLNFGRTNKQLYIETKKASYIKIRLQRKQDNKKRFYFKYVYFNDMTSCHCDNSESMLELGGIESKYIKQLHWYKNTKFSQVFDYWEKEHNLEKENQLVYHFSERHNHTLRPNREIFKQYKGKKLKWPVTENDCIYRRFSSINRKKQVKESSFMLFDKKAIYKLKSTKSDKNIKAKTKHTDRLDTQWENYKHALLILKYFDIFKQKVVIVDAILCEKDCTLNDILNHFLKIIVENSKIDSMVKLHELIEKNESKLNFSIHEEENAMSGELNKLTNKLDDSIQDAGLINGDILVIGLDLHTQSLPCDCRANHQLQQAIIALRLKSRGEPFKLNIEQYCTNDTRRKQKSKRNQLPTRFSKSISHLERELNRYNNLRDGKIDFRRSYTYTASVKKK